MTYKQIEQSREIRLWITQIAIPAGIVLVAIGPEGRYAAKQKVKGMANKVKNKFKKRS